MREDAYKILHIEDNLKDAEIIAALLSKQLPAVEIKHVVTKEEAKSEIKANSYDIVLSNYSVLNNSIGDLLKAIKDVDEHIPLVIITGAVGDEKAVETLKSGATDYVLKDKAEDLPMAVEKAISNADTARKRTNLKKSYTRFVETSPVGFYKTDEKGMCVHVDNATINIFGVPASSLLGEAWVNITHEEDREDAYKEWRKAVEKRENFEMQIQFVRNDGSTMWCLSRAQPEFNEDGEFLGHFGVIFDITRLKETEFILEELSYYDSLTDLPNRRFFTESLQRTLSFAVRHDSNFVLLYLDIDNFKKINDTKGHNFGDLFLAEVGARFKEILRAHDFIARIGGDEFAIIMERYEEEKGAIIAIERILEAFRKPYEIQGETIHSSISIGVVMYPYGGETIDALLQHADIALYKAKNMGRDTYQFYREEIQTMLNKQVNIENMLRDAVTNNEFYLVYQPQINAKTRNIEGYEALLRWNNPELGEVLPDDFIPIAETSGYMYEIGRWVTENALQQFIAWKRKYRESLPKYFSVSINVSPAQISHVGISKNIIKLIKQMNIPPRCIMVEVTETTYLQDPQLLKEVLSEINEFGVTVAIDDFGTGYSSLNIIESLPISVVKIDTSFVKNMFVRKENIPIIMAITNLSKNLSFKVVAEGVENKQQVDILTQLGCDYLQGFYFSEPLTKEDMEKYIKEKTGKQASGTA